jgi:lincosamide nucleotidyltransferase A/C/D/E
LEKEIRLHRDLDIAIAWGDVPKFQELLLSKGYKQIREDSKWNFVLGDSKDNEIDVHSFVYDKDGNIVDGIMYPIDSLKGSGVINGLKVNCISPEYVVKFHSGYDLKEKDYQDVSAVCKKFNIALPEEYKKFEN